MNSRLLKQFSLRELLALVLIVALAIGWWLDHRRLSHAVDEGKMWRLRAGTLEHVVTEFGMTVKWVGRSSQVSVESHNGGLTQVNIQYEPSQSVDDWWDDPIIEQSTGTQQ